MSTNNLFSSLCAKDRPAIVSYYSRLIDLPDFLRSDLPFNVIVTEQAPTPAAEVSDGGSDE